MNFIAFDFIILFDLNLNPNNLTKILFIRAFLIDCLMCLNISMIVLKISKSSLSGSILINLQPSSCSVAFCIQYFCRCIHFQKFLLQAYSHENISQSCNLKHYIVFAYFLLQINSLFLSALIVLLLK